MCTAICGPLFVKIVVTSLKQRLFEFDGLASIRASRVKAMGETPIKAGRAGAGKMKGGYFWPVYGEQDEVCFPFCEGRHALHVEKILGLTPAEKAVLLSDGYSAYTHYAESNSSTIGSASSIRKNW